MALARLRTFQTDDVLCLNAVHIDFILPLGEHFETSIACGSWMNKRKV